MHSDIINNSEEIAFYKGEKFEGHRLKNNLDSLTRHISKIQKSKFYMGSYEQILMKYGANTVAFMVLGLPVFGRKQDDDLTKIGQDSS